MKQKIARRATVLALVAAFGVGAIAPVGSAQTTPTGYPPGTKGDLKKCKKAAKKKHPPGPARQAAIAKCKRAFG